MVEPRGTGSHIRRLGITCPSNEGVLDQEEGGTEGSSGPFLYLPCSQVAALSRFPLDGNTGTGVGKVQDEGYLIWHSQPYAPASQSSPSFPFLSE